MKPCDTCCVNVVLYEIDHSLFVLGGKGEKALDPTTHGARRYYTQILYTGEFIYVVQLSCTLGW